MIYLTMKGWYATGTVLLLAGASYASNITIGPNGINSAGLLDFNGNPLTGAFAVIGQVEQGRPGDAAVWATTIRVVRRRCNPRPVRPRTSRLHSV